MKSSGKAPLYFALIATLFWVVPPAAWAAYGLTTVRQSANRMVAETVETLLARIETPGGPPRRVEIDGPRIIRASTRKPEETR